MADVVHELVREAVAAVAASDASQRAAAAALQQHTAELRRLNDGLTVANEQRAQLLERGEAAVPVMIRASEMADLLADARPHLPALEVLAREVERRTEDRENAAAAAAAAADADRRWWSSLWSFLGSDGVQKALTGIGGALAAAAATWAAMGGAGG